MVSEKLWDKIMERKIFELIGPPITLKALGFFLLVQHWGVFSTPLCKIRSRLPRKLKFTGLIAYVMFYRICKFESLTIIRWRHNDVITKNNGKMLYLTLTSIKFDPDFKKFEIFKSQHYEMTSWWRHHCVFLALSIKLANDNLQNWNLESW